MIVLYPILLREIKLREEISSNFEHLYRYKKHSVRKESHYTKLKLEFPLPRNFTDLRLKLDFHCGVILRTLKKVETIVGFPPL